MFLLDFLPQLPLSKYHVFCYKQKLLQVLLTSHNVMRCEYTYGKLELGSTLSYRDLK